MWQLYKSQSMTEMWYLLQNGHICHNHKSQDHMTEEKDIGGSGIKNII